MNLPVELNLVGVLRRLDRFVGKRKGVGTEEWRADGKQAVAGRVGHGDEARIRFVAALLCASVRHELVGHGAFIEADGEQHTV